MKIKKASWLFIALAIVMVASMFAGLTGADETENFGFIPNSGEASVSKVDLVSMEEVARYYTAPRVGDEVDLLGNPVAPEDANTIFPRDWRTSRIAMDADGNAWVINTGAERDIGLQGSIVRIQADTEGLDTHEYPEEDVYDFGTDEAVQVFQVGNPGDMPRAIAIDSDGYIWVGFYKGGQLMKYSYDDVNEELVVEGGPFGSGIKYYEMKFAPDGKLWISSRDSTPTVAGTAGVYSYDGATFVRERTFSPYSILISGSAEAYTVFVTAYSNVIHYRTSDGDWYSETIPGTNQNRGMAFDSDGVIWVASTVSHTTGQNIGWWNPMSDPVEKGYISLDPDFGTTPVGVGMDAAGLMWAVCRTDAKDEGFIQAFDPAVKSGTNSVGNIEVGFRPYAYGDFTVDPPDDPCYYFDTVWAYSGNEDGDEIPGLVYHNNKVDGNRSNAWGWTNFVDEEGTYVWNVYAGAGQNDTTKGVLAGTVTVVVTEDNGYFCAEVTGFDLGDNVLKEDHIWIGNEPLPAPRGRVTAAPGQLGYSVGEEVCELSADGFFVAIHGVVGILVECP